MNLNRRVFIGAHTSAAGGVHNAIRWGQTIGARAIALYVRPRGSYTSPPLTVEEIAEFKRLREQADYPYIMPHGTYLVNLGNPNIEKRRRFYRTFLDELQRCDLLGIDRYNFHPGSTVGACTKQESIGYIAECINKAHADTDKVICVLENSAGAGNTIGAVFEELAAIIDGVKDKTRVGVCLDTCHAFAAGYNLSTEDGYAAMMDEFERTIGLAYLRGVHLNDSSAPLASRRDRHANIGDGLIDPSFWPRIMNDARFDHMPMVLETPGGNDAWVHEISYLYRLIEKPKKKRK
ncbi:xylose isomerase-like protein [Syncephalis pseudoplumigaleata]|uniref:Apurinic-apyrimidinic endonuclease 1 n=1 Tax=Syncephalis pseudoplumigaleata TaxID=1712513 RepID=A0A4P9YUJ0_9FUNG|nr:xylose isomerase-like protein [Syncephalis pseudoplumigaleata]|eukprot:RKP23646.1 xylose isomerase-like protein [Syncephalis pseudoplumigaleata]